MADPDEYKQAAGDAAAASVRDGMVVGLGTGSTAKFAVDAIGRLVADGVRIVGIPTSERTAAQARSLNIPLATLAEYNEIDLTIDGADEIERGTLHLIKGHGGALLREKIVASASKRFVVVADETKLVDHLGEKFAIPVEVVPFGWQSCARRLRDMAANPVLRLSGGQPYVTDGGHYILDCAFGVIADPVAVARQLDGIVGVVEHGLFLGMASTVLLAGPGGVRKLDAAGVSPTGRV